MIGNKVFYHATIKRITTSFGRLFSNIYIERRQDDSSKGQVIQTLQVPISMAPKEKWLVRIEEDPTLKNHTYTSLPRMSFEIINYQYDTSRKINRNNKITCYNEDGSSFVYASVPYNLNINLYILTKTQEDAFQIIEQILPTFNPEYTLTVRLIDEMNIIKDIPVILNSVDLIDEYEGAFEQRRFILHTLSFTLKADLFGPVSQAGGVIEKTIVDVSNNPDLSDPYKTHISEGDVDTGQITRDEWIDNY